MSNKQTYIKVSGVSESLKKDLEYISKNLGITCSALIKPALRDLRDKNLGNIKQDNDT